MLEGYYDIHVDIQCLILVHGLIFVAEESDFCTKCIIMRSYFDFSMEYQVTDMHMDTIRCTMDDFPSMVCYMIGKCCTKYISGGVTLTLLWIIKLIDMHVDTIQFNMADFPSRSAICWEGVFNG